MIEQSLIPEKLKSFKYYLSKLPRYLKASKSFQEHFKIWFELLTTQVDNSQILLNMLNIFAEDYWEFLESVEGSTKDDTQSDILDKLGNLYGVSRNLTVTYTDTQAVEHVNEQLLLTNEEFLILIKSRIIQNYCEGTLKQINEYYASTGLKIYTNTSSDAATANMYLVYYEERELNNIDKMFLGGMLIIKSMGVGYHTQILIPTQLLVWDQINESLSNGWGGDTYTGGYWVI